MPMLEVDHLHTYYGHIHALKDVSLAVDKGEIVTLIGANGAGKSTTLKTISGLAETAPGVHPPGRGRPHPLTRLMRSSPKGSFRFLKGRRIFGRLTVLGKPGDGGLFDPGPELDRSRP